MGTARGMQSYTGARFEVNGVISPRNLKSNGFQTVKMGYVVLNVYTSWNLEALNPTMTQSHSFRLNTVSLIG